MKICEKCGKEIEESYGFPRVLCAECASGLDAEED